MENKFNFIDELVKNALFSPAYPIYELGVQKLTGSDALQKAIDEAVSQTRKKIVSEYGDQIVAVSKALLQAFVELLKYGGAGIGFTLGLLDLGREWGQQYANEQIPITLPDVDVLLQGYYKGFLQDIELSNKLLKWGYSKDAQELLLKVNKPRVSADTIRHLYGIGAINTKKALDYLKELGLDFQQSVLWLSAYYRRLDTSEAVSLYLRGEITEQELDNYLRWNGLAYDDIDRFKKLIWYIPSVEDLIRLAVREAFDQQAIEKFQLLLDFPSEILPYTRAQGLSDEWTKRYWVAHWQLPSITEGFAMFTRTTPERLDPDADVIRAPHGSVRYNVIGRKTLHLLLKTQDISPFWRDKLEQLAYTPLTRVDVRRAYDLGIVDEDEIYFTYRDLGYNDRNARILTAFTVVDTVSEERNKLRTELIEAYELGYISKEKLIEALKKLKFTQVTIDILVNYADYRKTNKFVKEYIESIKYDYIHGKLTDTEAHDLLVRYGVLEEDVNRYLRIWQWEKKKYAKTLTKEDIKQLLQKGIITVQQAIDKLVHIGYYEDDAKLLVKLWTG